MKAQAFLLATFLLLTSIWTSCSKSASTVDLRGRLINAPEDYYLIVCETGEQVWVDVYTLQPWWSQMSSAADAGVGPAPPLYVDMKAKVENNGPYGYGIKTNRAVVQIDEMRTIDAAIPAECSQ
jgi:hypothetical protein